LRDKVLGVDAELDHRHGEDNADEGDQGDGDDQRALLARVGGG
jgi:hypothetical protein